MIRILLIFLVISNAAYAVGTRNVCSTDKDYLSRLELYKEERGSGEIRKWIVKVPKAYDKSFSFRDVSLRISSTDRIERQGYVREVTADSLMVPVKMTEHEGSYTGYFFIRDASLSSMKLLVTYSSDTPGVVVFDGEVCEFELRPDT